MRKFFKKFGPLGMSPSSIIHSNFYHENLTKNKRYYYLYEIYHFSSFPIDEYNSLVYLHFNFQPHRNRKS